MKSRKLLKVVAFGLAMIICLGVLAACKNGTENPSPTPAPTERPVQTRPLVVAYQEFSQKFSPFFATTGYDQDVAGMTQLSMLTIDRAGAIVYNAIEGETRNYNGTDYFYNGIADITVEKKESTTVYTIKMREDIKFADGEPATIDDLIFYYYVVLDPAYTGPSTLSSHNIVGYENYRYNNSKAEEIDYVQILEDIDNNEKLQNWVKENIIKAILDEELLWAESLYTNEKYLQNETYAALFEQYPERKDLLYNVFYGTDEDYDSTAHTEEEVMAKLYEEYGYDYKALGTAYAGDPEYFVDQKMIDAIYEIALEDAEGATEVPNIAGIKKINDYTVEVTQKGYFANSIYNIGGGNLTPLHYYGDESMYDYENNKFGFKNREPDAMDLLEAKTTVPMGAGPYKFVKYENKVVYFEANEHYWKGRPIIQNIQFKETASVDMVAAVAKGEADVASEVTGSKERFKEIASYNTDTNAETGNTITSSLVWNLGYGYIGINSGKVNVGGDRASEASKNLRKGLATILAVYRDVVIDSYYGTAASVIEYPISSTSWAAPQVSDEGYRIAYSVDVDGNDIYTADMTAEQKYEAALQAAIGFFKAAGYTWDEAQGKFTAAPEGAKLEYEIIIPGQGQGDHPNFQVASNAAEALKKIGFTLTINDPADSNVLWNKLDIGEQELWTAAWGSTIDPDMYQVYYSTNVPKAVPGAASNSSGSNHYQIMDPQLDKYIIDARTSADQTYRKQLYKQCLDIIMDWAVEIPSYQRKNVIIFRTESIDLDTLTPDITTYWGWMSEIENLQLKNAD